MPEVSPADVLLIERLESLPNQCVLSLQGPMTGQTVASFRNAMRNESSPLVILDMTNVPFMDSGGLGSLVSAYTTCHKTGHQVVLAGVNSRILRLFEITRVESLFLMFPTLEDAVAAFIAPAQA